MPPNSARNCLTENGANGGPLNPADKGIDNLPSDRIMEPCQQHQKGVATIMVLISAVFLIVTSPVSADSKHGAKSAILVKTQSENPNVTEGLDIICHERSVTVRAGACRVGGKTVNVKETALTVDPAESVAVDDEWHAITDQRPRQWQGGTRLLAGRKPYRVMPGQLAPNSLSIHADAEQTGARYQRDKDYYLDEFWGALCRLPPGRIKPKQRVAISYVYGLRRVDRIEVTPEGKVVLRRGRPKVDCPPMPPKTRGSRRW